MKYNSSDHEYPQKIYRGVSREANKKLDAGENNLIIVQISTSIMFVRF